MELIRRYWSITLAFLVGCVITSIIFIFWKTHVEIDPKVRFSEVITWFIWVCLYIGSPFILKSYIDDEREVKKMVNEEINQVIKQADVINSTLKVKLNKEISQDEKDNVNIAFDILGNNIDSLSKMIQICVKDWNNDALENKYLKFKSSVSTDITLPNFNVSNDFYNRQYVEFVHFQDALKQIKITIMRR